MAWQTDRKLLSHLRLISFQALDGDLCCPQAHGSRHVSSKGVLPLACRPEDRAPTLLHPGVLHLLPQSLVSVVEKILPPSPFIAPATQRHLVGLGRHYKETPEALYGPSPWFQHPTGHLSTGVGSESIPTKGCNPPFYTSPGSQALGTTGDKEMSLGRIQRPIAQGFFGAWPGRDVVALGH